MSNEEKKELIRGYRFLLFASLLGFCTGVSGNIYATFILSSGGDFWMIFPIFLIIFLSTFLLFASIVNKLDKLSDENDPTKSKPHPNSWGSFLKFLYKYLIGIILVVLFSLAITWGISMNAVVNNEQETVRNQQVKMELHPPERFRGPVTKV